MEMMFIYLNNTGQKKYIQPCLFIDLKKLKSEKNQLIDQKTNDIIEQFILELHQYGLLELSSDILEYFIKNNQINYINDLRTIFILHNKS
ncbi:unnamed protein product [Adineta steineri]|uniref:Uncharacterized protein n=1 Tax=Adineta steineri TaxID=433720 RepID=A0A818ZW47_9BILA|nr:unnamed protein product [Adineta steineri]CAF1505162.1 unnamed protein product [Adineta steineri]CAF3761604.1 unnamed protein product [Adineta steineri]CAF3768837.1 unnamed protein product [Adineta steineri]